MSFETCAAAVKTQIETIAGFGDGAVTEHDYSVFNKGVQKAVVLEYGGFENGPDAFSEMQTVWMVEIHLFVRYKDDVEVRNVLRDARQAILERIAAYPQLGSVSGVFDATIVRGSRAREDVEVGGVKFFEEILYCAVAEEMAFTVAG